MDGMELPEALQSLFRSDEIEILARETGCIKRQRLLSGSTLAQTLVFGLLHNPEATGEQLAQAAMAAGIAISAQALEKRLDQATTANFLKAVLEEALRISITPTSVSNELLRRFASVEMLDSTTVALPDELAHIWSGCGAKSPQGGKAALKVQARMDLVGGGLQLELSAGRVSDQNAVLQTQDLKEGSLHVRDLGYFDVNVMATVGKAKAFFLSRLMNGTLLYDMQGNELDLLALLRSSHGDVDLMVQVGSRTRLPMRLIARVLPARIGELRRRRLRKKARRKGYQATKEALALRDWSIAITNVPADKLAPGDAFALLRLRWQIELLFKLWKSHGRLGHSRRHKPQRLLTETYAKLLAMLIQHWLLWKALGALADRSLTKGAILVQTVAWTLLLNLNKIQSLRAEIARVIPILKKTARVQKRRKSPAAFQILQDPVKYGYQHRA